MIDADILFSASRGDSECAKRSRVLLDRILSICHSIVLTAKIWEEYKTYASVHSLRWLYKMNKEDGKIIAEGSIRLQRVRGIRQAISTCGLSQDIKNKMIDDAHLIDAAFASDNIVLSMDHVITHFRTLSATVTRLSSIIWVNPEDDFEKCLKWLEDGTPDHPELHIRSQ